MSQNKKSGDVMPTLYHIPVCPFSQRVEILLQLKGLQGHIDFHVVDITKPRPDWLLAKTRGTTALPILENTEGHILKESLVILRYLEGLYPDSPVFQRDPYLHAIENMMVAMEGEFTMTGYRFVMNQDAEKRQSFEDAMLALYRRLDDFLNQYNRDGIWLFDRFGYAETVFTPMFMRFWFLEYYEGFDLPEDPAFERVRRWRDACIAHPAAQQVTRDEIVKLYHDYAKGAGNGALPQGRKVSSFTFEPHWSTRPWPPQDKYKTHATDQQLGL
jgi:glutathione S-transferase